MYRNVDIEYIHGRTATLTIFEDGVEVEKIILSDYKTRDEMHELFRTKGFIKKSTEEIAEVVERKRLEEENDAARARELSAKRREDAAARRKQLEEEENLKRNEKEELIRRLQEDENVPVHSEF
jgi:hypothetical protein